MQEKQKADAASQATGGTKLTSGELRLQKDVSELNLSKGTTIEFPNGKVGSTVGRGKGVVNTRDEQGADSALGSGGRGTYGCWRSHTAGEVWGVTQDKLLEFNVTLKPDEGYHKCVPSRGMGAQLPRWLPCQRNEAATLW